MVPGRRPGLGRGAYIAVMALTVVPLLGGALALGGLAGFAAGEVSAFAAGARPVTGRVLSRETERVGARSGLSVTEIDVVVAPPDGPPFEARVTLGAFGPAAEPGGQIALLHNPAADPALRPAAAAGLWGDVALVATLAAGLGAFALWATARITARREHGMTR